MQEIVIKFRPAAFIPLLIIGLVGTGGAAWLYIDRVQHQPKDTIDILRSVYMGLLVGFALLTIRAVTNMVSKKPAMVIHHNGITDHTNLYGQTVKWENILSAGITRLGTASIMVVYINNVDEVTRGMKKGKQRMATLKHKKVGTPIILSVNQYDFDPNTTVNLINSKVAGNTEATV